MTHKYTFLLAGIGACLLTSLAVAAPPAPAAAVAPAPAAVPAPTATPAPAASEAKVASATETAPASKPIRASGDARKCLKHGENKSISRCAEKYR